MHLIYVGSSVFEKVDISSGAFGTNVIIFKSIINKVGRTRPKSVMIFYDFCIFIIILKKSLISLNKYCRNMNSLIARLT